MSQANVNCAILREQCSIKYYYLKDSQFLNQREKNSLEKVTNLVNAEVTEKEFALLDKYLSDLMLIVKLRHESEYNESLKRFTTHIESHTDTMIALSHRMGDHTDAMITLSRRMGEQ